MISIAELSSGIESTAYASAMETVLHNFGNAVQVALTENLRKVNKGEGSLADSIQFNVESGNGALRFKLSLAAYYKWVDEGRRPGKFPPPQAILQWVNSKQLQLKSKRLNRQGGLKPLSALQEQKSLAYLVGRKISREGIKPTGFYSSVITEELFTQLDSALQIAFIHDILKSLQHDNH